MNSRFKSVKRGQLKMIYDYYFNICIAVVVGILVAAVIVAAGD